MDMIKCHICKWAKIQKENRYPSCKESRELYKVYISDCNGIKYFEPIIATSLIEIDNDLKTIFIKTENGR